MLHHILVKWNPTVEKQAAVQAVRALYAEATVISGVHRVEIREGKPVRPDDRLGHGRRCSPDLGQEQPAPEMESRVWFAYREKVYL